MKAVCRSGLTRHEYMRETDALCNLTPLPVRRSTSQWWPAQLQLCGVMSTVLQHSRIKCVVHASAALVSSTSLD